MSGLDLDALEDEYPNETHVLALITRLRAAEARTAWQPIAAAPRGVWLDVAWLGEHGSRDGRLDPTLVAHGTYDEAKVAASGGWWLAGDGAAESPPTHWRHHLPAWAGALPAAPEAP
ncbi:MAG: hypothetical protein IPK85_01380 [Gemmatimonadetes bacterium]|nr:hypothetical protein [Gemmatimonadota bacterium]